MKKIFVWVLAFGIAFSISFLLKTKGNIEANKVLEEEVISDINNQVESIENTESTDEAIKIHESMLKRSRDGLSQLNISKLSIDAQKFIELVKEQNQLSENGLTFGKKMANLNASFDEKTNQRQLTDSEIDNFVNEYCGHAINYISNFERIVNILGIKKDMVNNNPDLLYEIEKVSKENIKQYQDTFTKMHESQIRVLMKEKAVLEECLDAS